MVYIACTCICHTMYIAFTLCMSYKIYTTHRQHIYNTYTTHIQHIYNAYRTHIQHICNTYITHIQHICNTYITHIQHIYHTYITHTQHIYRIHMYTSYNIETDIWKMRDLWICETNISGSLFSSVGETNICRVASKPLLGLFSCICMCVCMCVVVCVGVCMYVCVCVCMYVGWPQSRC